MNIIKEIEETTNYKLVVLQYFDTKLASLLTCYGVVNKNYGVTEWNGNALIAAKDALQEVEAMTYPVPLPEPQQPPVLMH